TRVQEIRARPRTTRSTLLWEIPVRCAYVPTGIESMADQIHKPTIFFSHSSRDGVVLTRLKELFLEKTGGAIQVFQSSDGQSIPLGRNWVHQVEEGLNEAVMMIVFITPNSLASQWLYFESGFAYARQKRVVPVGFLGVDLTTLSPPLSLLQGFNITSHSSLDNLIVLANEAFDHKHSGR